MHNSIGAGQTHAPWARRFWTETERDTQQLLVFAGAALIVISEFWRGIPGITILVLGVALTAFVGQMNFRVLRGRKDESTELKEQLTRATAETARLEQEVAGTQSAVARIPEGAMFRLVTAEVSTIAGGLACSPPDLVRRPVDSYAGTPATPRTARHCAAPTPQTAGISGCTRGDFPQQPHGLKDYASMLVLERNQVVEIHRCPQYLCPMVAKQHDRAFTTMCDVGAHSHGCPDRAKINKPSGTVQPAPGLPMRPATRGFQRRVRRR